MYNLKLAKCKKNIINLQLLYSVYIFKEKKNSYSHLSQTTANFYLNLLNTRVSFNLLLKQN